jgi:cell division protein FtsQ
VEGLKRISANDINIVLGLSNQPIFSVNPVQVKQALQQAFPDLEAVSVKVKLPAKVAITAKERTPVISWVYNGQEQWVDVGGYAFPPRGGVDALIRVEAQSPPPAIEKALPTLADTQLLTLEFVEIVQQMAAQTPQDSPLVYDTKRGLGWVDGRGWQVYFGMDLSEIEMKLVVYQAMVQRLEQEGIRPAIISVEYVHAPYYRLER